MSDLHFPYFQGEISAKRGFILSEFGFRFGEKGTHTSRTIMTAELGTLFESCPSSSLRSDYSDAIVEKNVLGKATASTRFLTWQRLSEIYGLDPNIPIFRILRLFWEYGDKPRPLLALMVALARDPLLCATAQAVLESQPGHDLSKQAVKDALAKSTGSRLNSDSLDKVLRNTLSSWSQSGHLTGRSRKIRTKAEASPVSTAFALLLGYLLGLRGPALLESLFARVLDSHPEEILRFATEAGRAGIIHIKQLGGIFDISFEGFLTVREKEMADVAD